VWFHGGRLGGARLPPPLLVFECLISRGGGRTAGKKTRKIMIELHPICLPVGLPVSVSYQPSSVGIFGMVFGIKGGVNNSNNGTKPLS
jgi:hypothetical protein